MLEMEEIFFSGTFGGELLSLAAAKVVLERHLKQDLCGKLFSAGQNLSNKAEMALAQNGLEGLLKISGHPTWRFLNWTATEDYSVDEIRTYFMQEVFKRGLLVLSTHNVTLAHTPSIIDGISDIYTEVFGRLNRAISDRTLQEELKVSPLKPLFKVR
jgi:glutamate-1-semialdehyde aminotransferase